MHDPVLMIGNQSEARQPPPGPEGQTPSHVDHHDGSRRESASDAAGKLDPDGQDEYASRTLDRFLTSPQERDARQSSAEEYDARTVGGEDWQVHDLLPPVSPAPRDEGRHYQKSTIGELAQLLAPIVVLLSLSKRSGCITVREAWDAVPEPKPSYDHLNAVGDSLGQGRGGHALQLRRGARRGILICQENVNVCMRRMADADVRSLANRLGYTTREELLAAFGRLPLAETAPTA
jgi:hypothetical protein